MVSLLYFNGIYMGFTWDEERNYSGGTRYLPPLALKEATSVFASCQFYRWVV